MGCCIIKDIVLFWGCWFMCGLCELLEIFVGVESEVNGVIGFL